MPNGKAERGNATLRQCDKSLLRLPTGCVLSVPIQNNATEHSSCCKLTAARQDFALCLAVMSCDEVCYASALVRNLSVLSHAVLADAASNTSERASFMKAWCAS